MKERMSRHDEDLCNEGREGAKREFMVAHTHLWLQVLSRIRFCDYQQGAQRHISKALLQL